MIYDIVIVGGGIGGLYCAYQLLQRSQQNSTILVLEKERDVGGRVYTYHDKYMTVEAGAGRFHDGHKRLLALIQELGLSHKIVPITNTAVFAPSDGRGIILNSVLDAPGAWPISDGLFDIVLGSQNIPSSGLISRVIVASKLCSAEYLRNISFVDYARTVLTAEQVDFILDTFGYYSELVVMNALDSIALMSELGPGNQFFTLRGGLSQIIETLGERIEKMGGRILKGKTVQRVEYLGSDGFSVKCLENIRPYMGRKCICALPKQVVEKISFVGVGAKDWKARIRRELVCAPLCRIYAKFARDVVWFKGMPKLTTNNALRMIIPISEKDGVIMISYSDNKFANFWHKIEQTSGIKGVIDMLRRLIRLTCGIDMPRPLSVRVFYWECGVGYWGVGSDSSRFYREMMCPAGVSVPLFLCGEHFSEEHQQWMEGALGTASSVIESI
jgi:monoamine oxidase